MIDGKLWHNTKDKELPKLYGDYLTANYPEIPCLVKGQLSSGWGYGVRHWNFIEGCWDTEDADDYECASDVVEEWAYLDDIINLKIENYEVIEI